MIRRGEERGRSPAGLAERGGRYGGRQGLGRRGEQAAAGYLEARGFRILARSFRAAGCEIDLVARDGATLVFVEVKTRASGACGLPAEAVDGRKRRRLSRAAGAYLGRHDARGETICRFDVVEVEEASGGRLVVRHLRDAFDAR